MRHVIGESLTKFTLWKVILCLIITATTGNASVQAAPPSKPNIILFLTDDQDSSSIGAFGGATYTPHLDQMAREGMKFNRAYVSSTVCTASRYSFLTGRYAGNSYHKEFTKEYPKDTQNFVSFNVALEEDNMNVGSILAQNGYATGFTGKYHVDGHERYRKKQLDHLGLTYVPKDAIASPAVSEAFRMNELGFRELIKARGFTWVKHVYSGNTAHPYKYHNPEWNLAAAFQFIEENAKAEKPFYLSFWTTLSHDSIDSFRQSLDYPQYSGAGEIEPDPKVIESRKKLRKAIKATRIGDQRQVTGDAWVDATIGALLEKLKELNIDKNTLVVFSPDHGKTGKGSLYNKNATNIPVIMRWPAGITAGTESDELVQNIDMAPTFFEIAGAKVPQEYQMDGTSLTPLFKTGKSMAWRDFLYFEIGSSRSIMTQNWNYIANRYTKERVQMILDVKEPGQLPAVLAPLKRLGIGTMGALHPGFFEADQLYSLSKDPDEMNNLAYHPEMKATLDMMQGNLQTVLESIGQPYGEFIPGPNTTSPGLVDEQIAKVKKMHIYNKAVFLPKELGGGIWKKTPSKAREKEKK